MLRGQLCLYEARTDARGWSSSGGVGIVEIPAGTLEAERIMPFVGLPLGTDHLFVTADYHPRRIQDAGHELSDHVRTAQWPRPARESGIAGGGMFFRKTRIPAPDGREIMTVAICMYAPAGTVRSQMMYSLSGAMEAGSRPAKLSMHSPRESALLAENGIGMSALLKRAAWGWNDEPFALQSTMRLDVIDDAMESRALLDLVDRSDEQETRLQTLRRTEGFQVVAGNSREDRDYAEFRRMVESEHPHDDWTKPVTARQLDERHAVVERAVREMLSRRRAA